MLLVNSYMEHNNNQNILNYITLATKPNKYLDKIKEKINKNNETITVFGEEENRLIGWQHKQNFGLKLKILFVCCSYHYNQTYEKHYFTNYTFFVYFQVFLFSAFHYSRNSKR